MARIVASLRTKIQVIWMTCLTLHAAGLASRPLAPDAPEVLETGQDTGDKPR